MNDRSSQAIIGGPELAVLSTPYCGLHPESNQWADVDFTFMDGRPAGFDGNDVRIAMRRGWLIAEKLDQPGYVVPLGQADDLPSEMYWRYHAVPAFKTILQARAMQAGVKVPT